jgi:Uma2 family endonuclease
VEYDALVEQGLLADSRVELLLGALVDMTPQGPLHANVVAKLAAELFRSLPPNVQIRSHSPLALSDDSEPEPDVAVVPSGDYSGAHPGRALLVIEVADASLQKDRRIKAPLYASAGIPEFWLINLVDRVVEVHRHPSAGRYSDVQQIDRQGQLTPAEFPDAIIDVADLLP